MGSKNVRGYPRGSGPARLREWRLRTETTGQELAERIGLKHSASIYLYETGKLPLPYVRLLALQRITGIPVSVLAWPEQRRVMRQLIDAEAQAQAEEAAR